MNLLVVLDGGFGGDVFLEVFVVSYNVCLDYGGVFVNRDVDN